MLEAIIDFSLRHRVLVLAAALGVVVAGVVALARLPFDAFPDTTPVQVQVNAPAPALSPQEIERQIVWPIEQALSGLPDLVEIRSVSRFGLGVVTALFADGADTWRSRQAVSERLQTVEPVPGVEPPSLGPVATGLGEVFHYLVTGEGKTLEELRTAHDWIIRPQLRSVPGSAEVNAWGGEERQLQVLVDPARLAGFRLSLRDLVDALEANTGSAGGGVVERAGEATLVQGLALARTARDVEEIVVAARDGVPVLVRDVARVRFGHEIRRGAVTADGKGEAVLGLGFMLTDESSHEVTRAYERRLTEIAKTLPPGIRAEPVYERTQLVDKVLGTVARNLFEGALLVVAVLFAFLGNLRAGLIVAAAIPFSLLFAFDAMLRAGVAGTLMSLGAIDFGLLVDSGVILVENAQRRLAEAPADADRREVVRAAALEVRRPTLFGELIIAAVYLPILLLDGVEGKLFRPMALTVVFALAGSALFSLTVVPALASLLLKRPRAGAPHEPWLARVLSRAYRPLLAGALRRRSAVLAGAVLLVVAGALLAPRLGAEFVPRLQEGTIVINTVRLAGVSLPESVRYGTSIERDLLATFPDEIERVWSRTGTAEVATDPMGVEVTDIFLMLAPRGRWTRARTQPELVQAMSAELSGLPGMRAIFTQPIEMRLAEMTAGVRADLAVKIFGDDLEVLRTKAREVEALLRGIPGGAEVMTEQLTGQATLQVEVDRAAVARHGIPAAEVLAVVDALGGHRVGTLHEGERRFPIVARLDEAYRADADAVAAAFVTTQDGVRLPLSSVARISTVTGPAAIQREWGQRRAVVQANVRGRDLAGFVRDARAAVEERVALPPGYYVRFGGEFEHLERASRRLMVVIPAALALVGALLYMTYGRARDALRVFTGVPLAAAGGIVALWLRGMPFSISAGVGFVALSGIAVLADMVLVSTFRQLRAAGVPAPEAIRAAAERRLRPVLMTALVASVGFLPMALNTGIGAEVQRPLATVVIGGVMTSALLTLFVLPARGPARPARRRPARRRAAAGTPRAARAPRAASAPRPAPRTAAAAATAPRAAAGRTRGPAGPGRAARRAGRTACGCRRAPPRRRGSRRRGRPRPRRTARRGPRRAGSARAPRGRT